METSTCDKLKGISPMGVGGGGIQYETNHIRVWQKI